MFDQSTYFVPVKIKSKEVSKFLKINFYEYNIFSDKNQTDYTVLEFIDINGIIVGNHMPVKIKTIYDKTAEQVKTNAEKVATEVKSIASNMAAIVNDATGEVKKDLGQMGKDLGKKASDLVARFKKDKEDVNNTERQ